MFVMWVLESGEQTTACNSYAVDLPISILKNLKFTSKFHYHSGDVLLKPIVEAAGKDISHWFDRKTKEVLNTDFCNIPAVIHKYKTYLATGLISMPSSSHNLIFNIVNVTTFHVDSNLC